MYTSFRLARRLVPGKARKKKEGQKDKKKSKCLVADTRQTIIGRSEHDWTYLTRAETNEYNKASSVRQTMIDRSERDWTYLTRAGTNEYNKASSVRRTMINHIERDWTYLAIRRMAASLAPPCKGPRNVPKEESKKGRKEESKKGRN
jgi:hypothetical protein